MTTMPLWIGAAIVAATQGRLIGRLPSAITGISIDSRTIKPGDLYVAIAGDVHDGHSFVGSALANGASAALVSAGNLADLGDAAPLIVVPDALQGLIAIGHAARARSLGKIIAVTGSAGKTGTKDALGVLLSAQAETHFSVASFNNHWGVPLTLARFSQSARFGIFEIGMNHAGEITPLVAMVRPHVAIVTTIAPVHLAHFTSTDDIADAKAEIFSGVEEGGSVIINGDISETQRLIAHAQKRGNAHIHTFGATDHCDVRLIHSTLHPASSDVEAEIFGKRYRYTISSPGQHIVMNSLAVLAACSCVGADVEQAARDFIRVMPPQGRGARLNIQVGDGFAEIIDESYNANPASMCAALDNLGRMQPKGRRIAVLGDMLELGPQSAAMHASLNAAIMSNQINRIFLAGPMMQHLWHELPMSVRGVYAISAQELLPHILEEVQAGDVITIKGSLGSKMGPIVKALAQKFPLTAQKSA